MGMYDKFTAKIDAQEAINSKARAKERAGLNTILRQAPKFQSSLANNPFRNIEQQAFKKGGLEQFDRQRGMLALQGGQDLQQQDKMAAGQIQNAYAQLAQGGLSGGARERIAASGMEDALFAKQGLRAANQAELGKLGVQEAGAKLDLQKGVADAYGQNALQKGNFLQDQFRLRAETTAGLNKSDAERAIAAANKPSCFAPQTQVTMADGTLKPICDIKIGDLVKGGVVYAVQVSLAPGNIYNYANRVFVTGGHAVNENGVWKRVRNASLAFKADVSITTVYNIATTDHYIIAEGMQFADMHETEYHDQLTSEESIDHLNGFHFVLEGEQCSTRST